MLTYIDSHAGESSYSCSLNYLFLQPEGQNAVELKIPSHGSIRCTRWVLSSAVPSTSEQLPARIYVLITSISVKIDPLSCLAITETIT